MVVYCTQIYKDIHLHSFECDLFSTISLMRRWISITYQNIILLCVYKKQHIFVSDIFVSGPVAVFVEYIISLCTYNGFSTLVIIASCMPCRKMSISIFSTNGQLFVAYFTSIYVRINSQAFACNNVLINKWSKRIQSTYINHDRRQIVLSYFKNISQLFHYVHVIHFMHPAYISKSKGLHVPDIFLFASTHITVLFCDCFAACAAI